MILSELASRDREKEIENGDRERFSSEPFAVLNFLPLFHLASCLHLCEHDVSRAFPTSSTLSSPLSLLESSSSLQKSTFTSLSPFGGEDRQTQTYDQEERMAEALG